MALFFRGVQSPIQDKDGKQMWHPKLVKTGVVVNAQKIAQRVSRLTTVHEGDMHNIIRALTEVMRDELLNGHSVRLDGFGTFTLYIRSRGNGVESEDMVNASQINSIQCKFNPEYNRTVYGGTTRAMYEGVTFKHFDQMLPKDYKNSSDNNDDEDGGFIDPIE